MQNKPLVSIIIPSYNRTEYIIETLESVLNQDYENIEILISDNSENDLVEKILSSYIEKNKNIQYFRNETNIGMIPNWRKAIYERAKGEWCLILSDDDYFIDNSYISKAIELIKKNNEIKIVHSNFGYLFNETGYIDKQYKKLPEIIEGNKYFINFYNMDNIGLLVSLFHKETTINRNCFYEEIPYADFQSWLIIMLGNKVGFINDITAIYRKHSNNYPAPTKPETVIDYMKCFLTPKTFAIENNIFSKKELNIWDKKMSLKHLDNLMIGNLNKGMYKENRKLIIYILKNNYFKLSYLLNFRFSLIIILSFLPIIFYNNFENLYYKFILKRTNPKNV